jgi:hypothetical protein
VIWFELVFKKMLVQMTFILKVQFMFMFNKIMWFSLVFSLVQGPGGSLGYPGCSSQGLGAM